MISYKLYKRIDLFILLYIKYNFRNDIIELEYFESLLI